MRRFPKREPVIKLVPVINPIGKDIVLSINKSTLLVLLLFCIPVTNIIKRQELKVAKKNIFFTKLCI